MPPHPQSLKKVEFQNLPAELPNTGKNHILPCQPKKEAKKINEIDFTVADGLYRGTKYKLSLENGKPVKLKEYWDSWDCKGGEDSEDCEVVLAHHEHEKNITNLPPELVNQVNLQIERNKNLCK